MNINKSTLNHKFMKMVSRMIIWSIASLAGQTLADTIPDPADQRFANWEHASDTELDQLRGGFVLPNGVTINDFSIQRLISINDEVVFSSFSQLPSNLTLIANGDINQAPILAMSGLGTVIQNSMDNQTIKNLTNINIDVSNIKNLQMNPGGMIVNNFIPPVR